VRKRGDSSPQKRGSPSTHEAGSAQSERAMTQPNLCKFPQLLHSWCTCLCPEFSLVLSIWLSSDWSGLLRHGWADVRSACLAGPVGREATA